MSPEDKKELVSDLQRSGYLKTPRIIRAFEKIPREEFMPDGQKPYAYVDQPLPIGSNQTISAPHMVAMMTELLDPKPADKVLEIGGGSGYQAAILSELVKKIYSIELEPDLVKFARSNLKRAGIMNVDVIQGDGSNGYPEAEPYDKVIVTCATLEIFESWIDQLRTGGTLLAPLGSGSYQDLMEIKKTSKGLKKNNHGGCVFVPLRHDAPKH
jgi:protein-L-isoaspartate(D-aspartate) O-methyltransferase